jgi:hypothetical protein
MHIYKGWAKTVASLRMESSIEPTALRTDDGLQLLGAAPQIMLNAEF